MQPSGSGAWRLPPVHREGREPFDRPWVPPRYLERWQDPFDSILRSALKPGATVLDIGSGRTPFLAPDRRPADGHYVGLDISARELRSAPADSYDQIVVADVTDFQAELADRFDVVISWQVLEHVKPIDTALANMARYLKSGGTMASQLSGSFSLFGIVNKLLPTDLGVWAMQHLLKRPPHSVFPAHYDRCHYDALARLGTMWSEWDVSPRFKGGDYFAFAEPAMRAYVGYEEVARKRGWVNLATHYILRGVR